MTSIRLGEGALLSDLLEDQSSLDHVGSVDYFLSPFRNSMLLCSFEVGFPPNPFPIWGFLFVSSSAIFFPNFISGQSFQSRVFVLLEHWMPGCVCCSISKKRNHGPVPLADLYIT